MRMANLFDFDIYAIVNEKAAEALLEKLDKETVKKMKSSGVKLNVDMKNKSYEIKGASPELLSEIDK